MSAGVQSSNLARVAALARRDLAVRLSYRLQFMMSLGSGALTLAALFYLGRVVGDSQELGPYAGRYFEFAIVGVILVQLGGVALRTFSQTIAGEQRSGTLEVLLTTPTRVPTLLGGMFLVPLLSTAVTMVIYVALAVSLFGARFEPAGIVPAVGLLAATIVNFCAVGMLSAAVIVVTKRGDPITAVFAQLTVFLGGALFPVEVMPRALELASRVFPPYYGLRGLREALLTDTGLTAGFDELVILVAFAVVLVPASFFVLHRALRLARIAGTLGDF